MIRQRRKKGTLLIEFTFSAVILVIVSLVCMDFGVVLYAAWLNDTMARDAARAASLQDSKAKAYLAADAIVQRFSHNVALMTPPQITAFTYEPKADSHGRPNRDADPYVVVRTSTTITFPAPIWLDGMHFTEKAIFSAGYLFPIMRLPADNLNQSPSERAIVATFPDLTEVSSTISIVQNPNQ